MVQGNWVTKAWLTDIPIPIKHSSCVKPVKPVDCYLRKMPCSWANREAHKSQTKTQAKLTQTNQLFQMTVLVGMQLGGQKPRLYVYNNLFSQARFASSTHFYTVPRTAWQILQRRYSAMSVTEQRQLNAVCTMLGQPGSHMPCQLTSHIG